MNDLVLLLQWVTLGWMVIECSVVLTSVWKARSVSILDFGSEAKGIDAHLHAATFLNMADSRGSDNNEADEEYFGGHREEVLKQSQRFRQALDGFEQVMMSGNVEALEELIRTASEPHTPCAQLRRKARVPSMYHLM